MIPSGEPRGEIVLYETADGRTRVECRFADETLWLSQALIAELYQTTPQNVTQHLRSIFDEGEVDEEATCKDFLQVRVEGGRTVRRAVRHYNLDAILAVGYRVRSDRGVQFRRWATEPLREFLVKGFVLDDERLKHPSVEGRPQPDYFDELLDRIRDIRASEARMYLRVRDIFALAADYRPTAAETKVFFQAMQDSLHFAATGRTAAEIVAQRGDPQLPNMGLTTWRGRRLTKWDVTIAGNYLSQPEIEEIHRIVVIWLDFAEEQARRRRQIFLVDWKSRLDDFLRFNDRAVRRGTGSISHDDATNLAESEYDRFAA